MLRDSQTDRGVLSTDFLQHMARVKEGDYIFIGDFTILRNEASKDCDLVIGQALDMFLEFWGFALRNNSAYGLAITKM